MSPSTQLTAAELRDHPEFKHVLWDLKPNQKGKLTVGNGRGGPYQIAWELHGHGPNHLVVSCIIPVYLVSSSCAALGLSMLQNGFGASTVDPCSLETNPSQFLHYTPRSSLGV